MWASRQSVLSFVLFFTHMKVAQLQVSRTVYCAEAAATTATSSRGRRNVQQNTDGQLLTGGNVHRTKNRRTRTKVFVDKLHLFVRFLSQTLDKLSRPCWHFRCHVAYIQSSLLTQPRLNFLLTYFTANEIASETFIIQSRVILINMNNSLMKYMTENNETVRRLVAGSHQIQLTLLI